MKALKKHLKLNQQQYYETHLYIVSSVLPVKLTPKEVEVLACFMSLDESQIKDRFGVVGRSIVKEKLNISAAGLSNYLKALKDKMFIVTLSNNLMDINPILNINNTQQEYYFKLENNGD